MFGFIKIIALAAIVFMVAVFTAPMWGGCGFNHELCSSWCSVRHMGSDVKAGICKTSCAADKVSCLLK